MTDLEISKALAIAIGWGHGDIIEYRDKPELRVWWHNDEALEYEWRAFDYRDWAVIVPIAERYDCFPRKDGAGKWLYKKPEGLGSRYADTPQKAIAMAVIGAKK